MPSLISLLPRRSGCPRREPPSHRTMPLFLTEEEFRICSNDPLLVALKADEFIVSLRRQMDVVMAEADAASVTAEQIYNVLEQRYASLSAENEELAGAIEKKAKELAEVQNAKLGIEAISVSKDREIEGLKVEVLELHKSKMLLLELMAQKEEEIEKKKANIQMYIDELVVNHRSVLL